MEGEEALGWVRGQNERAVAELGDPKTSEAYKRILAILDSKEKIPYVSRLGDWYYNFWQDEKHQKGLWRRTTLQSFRSASPVWEKTIKQSIN